MTKRATGVGRGTKEVGREGWAGVGAELWSGPWKVWGGVLKVSWDQSWSYVGVKIQ